MTTPMMVEKLLIAVLSTDFPARAAFDFIKKHKHLIGWKLAEDQIMKEWQVALVYLQRFKCTEWPEFKAELDAEENLIGQILYREALREDGINVARAEKDWLVRFGPKAQRPQVVRPNFGDKKQ